MTRPDVEKIEMASGDAQTVADGVDDLCAYIYELEEKLERCEEALSSAQDEVAELEKQMEDSDA